MVKQITKEERVEKKNAFIEKIQRFFREYRRIMVVSIDHVPSNMMAQIRHSLKGQAELLCGKNSIVRYALKHIPDAAGLDLLMDNVRGSIGLIFSNADLKGVRDAIAKNKVPAPAKAGNFADNDVVIPKGNTGLEPTQTSFLQALNIATKINKGTIEILNDVTLIKKGAKIGGSEATLLAKLNIMPFFYEMRCKQIFEAGSMFPADILDITDDQLMTAFHEASANVAALALGVNIPTAASLRFIISNAFQNVAAVSLATGFAIPQLAAATAAPAAAAPAHEEKPVEKKGKKEPEKPKEPEPVEDDGAALGGLFD
ncbi:putative 60S acidic ribosomal protein P0 [Paratrimastix pyriformis]|uniref:60S acidic ribosomal protein P0 n=1 Tax=Paratrimastix pyriformis TaxID=342808 RepID=A0ABQ8UW67_9EUKA|nr:putative 60S acidic ribosomal protein P0 [Paratrimastix pyriformis]